MRPHDCPEGPRIYTLFPRLIGPIPAWRRHLARISAMGFNWLHLNPFDCPGASGSLYAIKHPLQLNPLFAKHPEEIASPERVLSALVADAEGHGLAVMLDLVIGHTSRDAPLVETHPDWYVRDADGDVVSPCALDPATGRTLTVWNDLAALDYRDRPAREHMIAYWTDIATRYARLGFRGFRCCAAARIPVPVWAELIAAVRAVVPGTVFVAETLGARLEDTAALAPAGFNYLFNSSKWWDFRADWLLDHYERFRSWAPSIAFPESHDTDRLIADVAAGVDPAPLYRRRYLFSALFSTGVLIPVGYEFGFSRRLDAVRTQARDWERPHFDISGYIGETNRMRAMSPVLNQEGPQVRLGGEGTVAALLRWGLGRWQRAWCLTLINTDDVRPQAVPPSCWPGLPGSRYEEITPGRCWDGRMGVAPAVLRPAEIRVYSGEG